MDVFTDLFASLSEKLGTLLPGVFGALVILLVGFLIASILKSITLSAFRKTAIDEKISQKMDLSFRLDAFVAKLVYYLVLLFVLLMVLDTLGINNVLDPLKNMLNQFLGFIPNIIAAGIIGFIGYVIASISSEGVGFVAGRVEAYSEKLGFKDPVALTKILKQLVFVFVFIPILITALDRLGMRSISEPATNMLNQFMAAIPKIIAAAIILGVFYVIGKFVVNIVTDLLSNMGIDQFSKQLGLTSMIGENTSLAKLIGNTIFFFIMFAGIISAADKLEMSSINGILEDIFTLTGKIFFGLVIMALGSFIANKAYDALSASKDNAGLATLARFAILGIFVAISLSTMGIAQNIVNLAFGLTLGAVAVAFALSFGLGGREAAGKQMEYILKKFRKD